MKRMLKISALVVAVIVFGVSLCLPVQAASDDLAFVIPVNGEITSQMAASIRLAFADAARAKAKLIILEIDTFGGFVDASDQIKTIVYDSGIPVYAYVKKAISGGTYAALACNAIYMHPGATLGAVEPVADGKPVTDEKVLSVIEGQLRAMAENRGRDPAIASAMVRKEIGIPNIVQEGKLLTLTAKKAIEVGYAEGIVSGYEEIPKLAGVNVSSFKLYTESWSAGLARFLVNPYLAAVLLTIGLSAMIIEILTPGFGVPGALSIVAFALYFGGHLLTGFARSEYIILFVVGILLLGAEVFTVGFGFLGFAGLACIAASIVLSAANFTQGMMILGLAILLTVVVLLIAFRFLRKSRAWNKIVLQDTESKERGYVAPKDLRGYLGAEGVAVTPLRPSGAVQINGQNFDAITEGGYLAAGTAIAVIGVSSGSVVVAERK